MLRKENRIIVYGEMQFAARWRGSDVLSLPQFMISFIVMGMLIIGSYIARVGYMLLIIIS